ncbi:MAG: Ig-like domain-containing protein, partial [Vicinamibacterales bacterium]
MELRAPSGDASIPIVGPAGGPVSLPTGEALDVPAGAFTTDVPVTFEGLSADGLGFVLPPSLSFVGAASIGFPDAALATPIVLSVPRPAQVDGTAPILLLRVATIDGATRLLFVGTGRINGTRIFSDRTVPGVSTLLEGLSVGGRYLFARATFDIGFATGTILGTNGLPAPGALVTTTDLPVVALSDAAGHFVVPAKVGPSSITGKDLRTKDLQTIHPVIPLTGSSVAADLAISALTLTVTSLTPVDGATSVPLSSAIVASFSSPVDPASLSGPGGSNIRVTAADGSVVSGVATLAAGNTRATFRPTTLLTANTSYTATVLTTVKDAAGRPLPLPATTHFTSLDTAPPAAPAAGSITATIPSGGLTTVTATQGTAGAHDTVSIINTTRKSSFPALVAANGSFSATFAVGIGDKLQVSITDPSGNRTVVSLPAFTRTNPDGSLSTVVGAEGGRINGPGGTAVDVPADALPDGTIVTIETITEAEFPTQLTEAQKEFFGFAGGIRLDFGGITPSHYVNVSIPPTGGETRDDRWIVGQVISVDGQQVLNVVDTARIIDGRITTSSPPCPGVQAAAAYGFIKSTKRSVGVNYGRFSASADPFQGLMARMSQPMFGGAGLLALPYVLFATPTPVDVCIPILSGRVTVQPNSQRIVIDADQFTPADRQILVRNQETGQPFYFPRNVAEFRFVVQGTSDDAFRVKTVSNGNEKEVAFDIGAGPVPGTVNVRLDASALNVTVASVIVENVTKGSSQSFPQDGAATKIAVAGGSGDSFEVTVLDASGKSRSVSFTVESPTGAGNLIARALPATIDPGTNVVLERLDARDPSVVREAIQIPPDTLQFGGFEFSFNGDPATDVFRLTVAYNDGRAPDSVAIPSVAIVVSNPVTGRVIKTFNALVAPPNEPFNLGSISGDLAPPVLTGTPTLLNSFDPSGLLTFQFSEGVDRDSALQGIQLLDVSNAPVSGQIRMTNQNKTVTFVPDAPLKMGEHYTLKLDGLTDGSGNAMKPTSFNITTFAPSPVREPFTAAGTLRMLRSLTLVKKPDGHGGTQTLGYGVTGDIATSRQGVIFDLTKPDLPVLLGTLPGDDLQRITVVQDVKNLVPRDADPCIGGATFSGDLAIASTGTPVGTAVRFFNVTDPAAPCLLGAKSLTLNPAYVQGDQGVVVSDLAFARSVVSLPNGPRINSYSAIENVGLMLVDVGGHIPTLLPRDRLRETMAGGSYTDVVTAGGRLLAIDRGTASLDIFDSSLAQLSSTRLGLNEAIALTYAEGVPFDLDGDGQ